MTRLYDDPSAFTEDMLAGFLDVHRDLVAGVPGGVVRATETPPGKVAVVVGGGSGHYPAFCGVVGPGFADGAVVGNIFTSPSAQDAYSVGKAAAGTGGLLFSTGNYAGDVMNFRLAQERLCREGVDTRVVFVTDDIASAPPSEAGRRRGIAGDFVVFKVAGAAAEEGYDLDAVERVARHANDRTRTLGVAFSGCTMPGGEAPLFTVPAGRMGVGLGIHGEPGVGEDDLPSAAGLAERLVSGVLAERPAGSGDRVTAILNGLGTTKYEELFVVWRTVARLLADAGLKVVAPEVGELVTSLDMAGCSLTLVFLDDELERLWLAPADTPAYRRGRMEPGGSAPRRTTTAGSGAESGPPTAASTEAGAVPGTGLGAEPGTGPRTVAGPRAGTGGGAEAGIGAAAGAVTGAGANTGTDTGTRTRTGRNPSGDSGSGRVRQGSAASRACGRTIVAALNAVDAAMRQAESELGRIDAVAGDGDHGRGMVKGASSAVAAGRAAADRGAGARSVLVAAGEEWAAKAGGTSGVLWGAMLTAIGERLGDGCAHDGNSAADPLAGGPQTGGNQANGPQTGDAQAGGPQTGGNQAGGPQTGGIQAGGPRIGGGQAGGIGDRGGFAGEDRFGGASGRRAGVVEVVAEAVRDGLAAVRRLGGAELGDKTMVDALAPFADVLAERARDGADLAAAWRDAARACEEAARATAGLRPRIGRARPLAERSVGTPDAGATSLALCAGAVLGVLDRPDERR